VILDLEDAVAEQDKKLPAAAVERQGGSRPPPRSGSTRWGARIHAPTCCARQHSGAQFVHSAKA
jgi:citrate lyase beta subunit